jgi:hypothetical protein
MSAVADNLAFTRGKSAVVRFWAAIGAVFLLFEVYVWAKWISGPNFKPTDPGPDPISASAYDTLVVVQAICVMAALSCVWFWIVRPWIREGHCTTDGMIAICMTLIFFYDPSMNYLSTALLYNSHLLNYGAWTMGSWPGWTSPNGNLLPEPILISPTGYLFAVYGQIVFVLWLLRKYSARHPRLGVMSLIGIIVAGLTLSDTLAEIAFIRIGGVYTYPGGIRAVTVFAGDWFQFPLTEGFFFGGLGLGCTAILQYFKNDKGQTFVESGLDALRISRSSKQAVKFLALFGFVHASFLLVYMLPNFWLSTHSDPYPTPPGGRPSYFINNMCVYGPKADECPGPGVMIPRPKNNPF